MALTPKLNENVMDAIAEALKSLKPRPAVDRVLTARLTGKRAHYCQILLAYSPSEFGVAYVNLSKPSEPKVTIHDPQSKGGRHATAKELTRLKRIEKAVERKAARQEKLKAKAAESPKAFKTNPVRTVKFDLSLTTLENTVRRTGVFAKQGSPSGARRGARRSSCPSPHLIRDEEFREQPRLL